MDNLGKVFKAYDIRGVYSTEIDEDLAWKIGFAAGQFLRSLLRGYDRGQASANRLVVGRDMRPHSQSLSDNLIEGIIASGLSCVDVGMCDTPMIYFAVNHLGACGGVQVTASHNPIEYNGFKVSGLKARPVGEDTGLKEIRHIVSTLRRIPQGETSAKVEQMDLWSDYRGHVLQSLKLSRPLKVAVDASNGMAGKMMPEIFDAADLEIIPLNYEFGGRFAHPPNPLIDANLKQVCSAVKKHKADFGICFDGDADRCMFVDEKGQIVRCDYITAMLARHFLKLHPASTVVYDLRSSRVVAEEILASGGTPRRERVGHAFMKKAMADAHGIFGGELSGHFYFRDNYNADSGAIVFATVASIVSSGSVPLGELIEPLKRYVQSGEINFRVKDKAEKMNELAEKFADGQADSLDGVTIQYDDWWFNVRPSNTEPFLRLNLEAKNAGLLKEKLDQIQNILGEPVEE
ncbi:MAG: phosphomannomutase/phosphoglucomutase [Planctomycetota bacterium]|nr:phosphomannomutase/phosphoglucomutase [Planctomycetota bacterium]